MGKENTHALQGFFRKIFVYSNLKVFFGVFSKPCFFRGVVFLRGVISETTLRMLFRFWVKAPEWSYCNAVKLYRAGIITFFFGKIIVMVKVQFVTNLSQRRLRVV